MYCTLTMYLSNMRFMVILRLLLSLDAQCLQIMAWLKMFTWIDRFWRGGTGRGCLCMLGFSFFCLFIASDSTPESLSSCRYHGNMEPPCQQARTSKRVECVRRNQMLVSQTLPSLFIVCISVWFSQIISGCLTCSVVSLFKRGAVLVNVY